MTVVVTERSTADESERERIRTDLANTLIVEAAAGTGKTSELVARMVEVLRSGGARLEQMIAVTYTDAAAGELKLRLRGEIEKARAGAAGDSRTRAFFNQALRELEEARIGTIHAFCADLLRERPVEAGVDPLFEMAPDDAAGEIRDRAFDRWFESELASPSPGVRRILRRRSWGEEGPRAQLRRAVKELAERRDFPTAWRRVLFAREPEIDALIEEIAAVGAFAALGDPSDYFTQSLAEIERFAGDVRRRESVRPRDYDGLEAELYDLTRGNYRGRHWKWRGRERAPRRFDFHEVRARRDRLNERLQDFIKASGADLAPLLRDELWPVVESYERLKERAGVLDFLDLLLKARDLVRGNAAVRRELQQRFTHIFVDEFQDSDPLQVEILLLLATDDPDEKDWRQVRPIAGKLFLIADPKQSIYRWRRADVELYERVKRQLVAHGAQTVSLSASFRAVPELQEMVNTAFTPVMRGDSPSQASYVPLRPWRTGLATQPAVVALPVPAPYGDFGEHPVGFKIDESLPHAVAAFVDWLVHKSSWTVSERGEPGARVPIAPRHVCLLFRRMRSHFDDVTRSYVRALEARGLEHVLVGGGSFHRREEVEAIRNALHAIERPDDELSVFATLRGPLFAFPDGLLLAFSEEVGTLHPFRRIPETLPGGPTDLFAEVAAALALLRDLHRGRNYRPVAATIERLLAATRAHAGFANWPAGEQALANVLRLVDLARRAERTRSVTSFRAFADRLAEDAEHGEASEAPTVEEGTEGVRITTVHKAKGLEFPVVILADLTTPATFSDPQRFVDSERRLCATRICGCAPDELLAHTEEERAREDEEAKRLLYVACTRARDLLVAPVIGDEPFEGWLAPLHPVLYPEAARARTPSTAKPPGCPSFGTESVPGRPDRLIRPRASVAPGLHRPQVGAHFVTWWDPAVLGIQGAGPSGLRQEHLLKVDESGMDFEQEGIRAHAEWQESRARVRAAAGVPGVHAVTATELAAIEEPENIPALAGLPAIEEIAIGTTRARPHGRRFGTLVHALLAAVDLDAGPDQVRAVAELEGRVLGAPEEEIGAAVDAVTGALAHPLLARAAAAPSERMRREVPVALRLDDGVLVEGVVDAAFYEDEPEPAWIVLDFKTDYEIQGRRAEYRRQLGLYMQAIARATGCAARGVLFRVC